ncbi:recombinase family protein [Amycolatopsis acidiphila]
MSLATPEPPSSPRTTDQQAQCTVRVGSYQRQPEFGEDELLNSYVASQPGWQVRLHCTDHYASGATMRRPGLQRVLKAARSGEIDVLVVCHIHNLSRSHLHLTQLLSELRSRSVRVVSAANPSFDTETPFGAILACALDVIAGIERDGAREDRRTLRRPTPSARASIRRAVATSATGPLMATTPPTPSSIRPAPQRGVL